MRCHSRTLDHLGIVSGICDKVDLVEQINSFFPEVNRKVSIGESTKAMILNALGFVSRPLYLTPEFFATKPIDILFRSDLKAKDFHDDTLGDALDSLYKKDVTTIFSRVAFNALQKYGVEPQCYHLDSTSFSFHGNYPEQAQGNPNEPIPIKIVRGFSKDQRPDLKQAVFTMISAYKSTLPVWFEASDGNSSDKKIFPEVIERFLEGFNSSIRPCIIVDSALFTKANIQILSAEKWLSRVPETINEAKELIQKAESSDFEPTEQEGYSTCEYKSTYGGVEHRWIQVFSEKAMHREQKTFDRKLKKAEKEAQKELTSLKKKKFGCSKDAEQALETLEKKWKFHHAPYAEFEEVPIYKGRGRPKKNEQAVGFYWSVVGELDEKFDVLKAAKKKMGRFILATNVSSSELSKEKALSDYKAQGSSIERGFRFLKDPMFFSSAFYLQKPSRVMALMMIMTLSLLIYSLAEHDIRTKLKEKDETVPDQKGKPTQNITMRRVFQMFEGIEVLYIQQEKTTQRVALNMSKLHERMIRYFGQNVEKYYFFN